MPPRCSAHHVGTRPDRRIAGEAAVSRAMPTLTIRVTLTIIVALLAAVVTAGARAAAPPANPAEGICEQVVTGETVMTTEITTRDKAGEGGETNADGWVSGDTTTLRLYGATDNALTHVTFTAKATEGFRFRAPEGGWDVVTGSPTGMGTLYADGYTRAATGIGTPVISADGTTITLTVTNMPARSAYAFNVIAVRDEGAARIVLEEQMRGSLVACNPPPPVMPPQGVCEQLLAGRTVIPFGAGDVTVRDKHGVGGETNADGWKTGDNYTLRLYGATDNDLDTVTFTATAAQGFTFAADSAGTVITASPTGMGQLYANGYTVAATGIGTPVISADGRTVSLTVTNMPADSAFAFNVTAVPDGDARPLVLDTVMVGDLTDCTVPPLPEPPVEGICEQVLTGRTIIPFGARDVTVRDKHGDGGETNADGWKTGDNHTLRLYGATDNNLDTVTFTATAAQGFTFAAPTAWDVRTGGTSGMGSLPANGYTEAITGVGTPLISEDGRTVTLTISGMPAKSAFAFNIVAVPGDTAGPLVLDTVMAGDLTNCTGTLPTSTVTGVCDVDNDIVTVGAGAGFTGVFNGWTGGTGTVTSTTNPGHVFWIDGRATTTHTETVTEVDRSACPVTPPSEPEPPVTPPSQPQTPVTPPSQQAPGTPAPATPAPVATPVPVTVAGATTAPARLRITKVGPRTLRAGTRITYVIRVTNTSRVAARNVVVNDILPRGMSYVRANVRGSLVRGKMVWRFRTLAPGQTRVIRVTFRTDRQARGTRTNIATAVAGNATAVRAVSRVRITAVAGATRIPVPRVTG